MLQVIFIFSVWILIKQIIVSSYLSPIPFRLVGDTDFQKKLSEVRGNG